MPSIDWPRHFPRILNGFAERFSVANAIRSRAKYPKLLELARAIHLRHRAIGHYRDVLQMFLNLCLTIDDVKQSVLGHAGSTETSNLLMRILGLLTISDFAISEESEKYLASLIGGVTQGNSRESWYSVKLMAFQGSLQSLKGTRAYINTLVLKDKDLRFVGGLEDLKQGVDEIMGRLTALRRYGVKSCYFQDGLMHHSSNAWVFYCPQVFRSAGLVFSGNPLAVTSLALKRDLVSLDVEVSKFERYSARAPSLHVQAPYFVWSMDEQAEFSWAIDMPFTSVRGEFEAGGRSLEYEALRLIQAMRLFDLVTAVEVVDRMPRLAHSVGALPRLGRILGMGGKEVDPVLFLRRIQYLENESQSVDDLEREIENAAHETQRRCRHQVVGHIRRLPVGRKCSHEARSLALEEIGVELADGETYIRSHTRGSEVAKVAKLPRAKSVR